MHLRNESVARKCRTLVNGKSKGNLNWAIRHLSNGLTCFFLLFFFLMYIPSIQTVVTMCTNGTVAQPRCCWLCQGTLCWCHNHGKNTICFWFGLYSYNPCQGESSTQLHFSEKKVNTTAFSRRRWQWKSLQKKPGTKLSLSSVSSSTEDVNSQHVTGKRSKWW